MLAVMGFVVVLGELGVGVFLIMMIFLNVDKIKNTGRITDHGAPVKDIHVFVILLMGNMSIWIAIMLVGMYFDVSDFIFFTTSATELMLIITALERLIYLYLEKCEYFVMGNVISILCSVAVTLVISTILNNYMYKYIWITSILYLFLSFNYKSFFKSFFQKQYKVQELRLKKKILETNKIIRQAISILQYSTSNITKSEYKSIRVTVNQLLESNEMYKTFQPMFKEDGCVLCVIKLMDILSNKSLDRQYNDYKKNFEKINEFQLLEKAKNGDDSAVYIANINSLIDRLSATLNNNWAECQGIQSNQNVTDLYKKYNLKTPEKYMNALFPKLIITMSIAIICLIALNI